MKKQVQQKFNKTQAMLFLHNKSNENCATYQNRETDTLQ